MQTVNLQIILTPEQRAQIINELVDEVRNVAYKVAKETASAMQDPMREMPLVATAGFWAKQKGKSNGKTYSESSFQKWAKDNGIIPIRQNAATFYHREDARKWIYGEQEKMAQKTTQSLAKNPYVIESQSMWKAG